MDCSHSVTTMTRKLCSSGKCLEVFSNTTHIKFLCCQYHYKMDVLKWNFHCTQVVKMLVLASHCNLFFYIYFFCTKIYKLCFYLVNALMLTKGFHGLIIEHGSLFIGTKWSDILRILKEVRNMIKVAVQARRKIINHKYFSQLYFSVADWSYRKKRSKQRNM